MNRPKKTFIPTTLSDLNIDTLSIGSNSDRSNNNSNGARLNNFDRFKATSSSNISFKHSNFNNTNNNNNFNNGNNNNFARTSKMYGSQSNVSTGARYQTVNNSNINSPSANSGDTDKWLQAWEMNNNNYRAPSYHPKKQTHSFPEKSNMYNNVVSNNTRSSIDYNRSNSNNLNSVDPFDPFDDPWSGT